jgi:hypothetical protein
VSRSIRIAIFIGVLGALATPSIRSQAGSAAPAGSYIKVCNNISMANGTLTATCKTLGNGTLRSSVDVNRCGGDIGDNDGTLQCYARSFSVAQGNAIPRGSYTQSCHAGSMNSSWRTTRVQGTILYGGVCGKRQKNTYTLDPSLDLRTCPQNSDIANIDGQLICLYKP